MRIDKISAIAITAALACGSSSSCKPSVSAAAPMHALPVSERAVKPAHSPGAAAPTNAPGATALAITQIRAQPLYKQAQQACAAKHYSHAADLLLKLSRAPGLTQDESAFCFTQVNVCRKDAGLSPLSQPDGNPTAMAHHRPLATSNQLAQLADCGPRALAIVCQQLKVRTDIAALRNSAGTTKNGTTMEGLAKAVQSVGLKADGIQTGRDALPHTQMPAIAWCGNHYIAVLEIKGGPGDAGTAVVHDPNQNHETVITQEQLLRKSNGGYLLLVHR